MTRHTCNPFHATEAEVAACPGCQAGDTYDAWRAHAEALAEVLEEALFFAEGLAGWDAVDIAAAQKVRAVLARLPAQALAERRALEACAEPLSVFIARHRSAEGAHLREECERWAKDFADCRACCAGEDTLAALDAARKPATDAHTPEWVGWDGIK